jgi:predicted phage terminase large subunit-like protein
MSEPRPITAAEAAKHLLKLDKAASSYRGYIEMIHPEFTLTPFQIEIIDTLDKLEKGLLTSKDGTPIRGVLMTMPPRHAKSTFCTIGFPAYYMARDPTRFVLSTSYNGELAKDFGRQCRDLAQSETTAQIFPDLRLNNSSTAADVWRTDVGGAYFGVGIGGTTTGRPSNLLLIDDPIKSREEAESITMRNKVWNFYTSGLQTRKQPDLNGNPPIEIVVLTRWHPDDLAGRIMASEDWKEGRWIHLDYQAITTVKGKKISRRDLPKDHPMYVEKNVLSTITKSKRFVQEEKEVALWPERFPLEDLKRKQRMNPRDFESLYQQRPYIEGGNILKTEWWRYWNEGMRPEQFASLITVADTAFKKNETADYSVIMTGGVTHDGDIYILGLERGRWEYPELKQRLITNNMMYRGNGLRATYIEDKASGQSLIQDLRRQSGLSVIPYKVGNDKVMRANAVTPLIEGGRVYLPEVAPWLDAFMQECSAFPSSKHDDQVDALTMLLDILSRQGGQDLAMFQGGFDISGSLNQQVKTTIGGLRVNQSDLAGGMFRRWGE